MKKDVNAQALYGCETYAALPKSVLALAAYHLARRCHGDNHEDGMAGLRQEIAVLGANGIITEDQAKRAAKALADY